MIRVNERLLDVTVIVFAITLTMIGAGCAATKPSPVQVLMLADDGRAGAEFAERLVGRGDVEVRLVRHLVRSDLAGETVLLCDHREATGLSDEATEAVIRFVESGGGLVAVGDSGADSGAGAGWGEFLGATSLFQAKAGLYQFVVLDPADATVLSLGGEFSLQDRPYAARLAANNVNLLIRTAGPVEGGNSQATAGPAPVAWTRRLGKGRIFVTTLGQGPGAREDERYITLIHNAVRWAGGHLADTRHNVLTKSEEQSGFELLFNGRDLTGWTGDPKLWSAEDGELVGRGANLPHNVFLTCDRPYANFLLRFSVKLINHNSGVQFRSQQFPEYVVKGYQADVADHWYGSLYDEGTGRGVLANGFKDKGEKVARLDGWNDMTVKAVGPRITITLNGLTTVEFTEVDASRSQTGVIALQLHKGPPIEVRFRDIRIRRLAN
jgi:type 1 glutamine amidotransferase